MTNLPNLVYSLIVNYLFVLFQNLLNSVVERVPKIEAVNVNGGRFIREGKVRVISNSYKNYLMIRLFSYHMYDWFV